MTDSKTRYATLLGVTEPWGVELLEMKREAGEVHVWVPLPKHTRWVFPECQAAAPIHDHQERTWRHLDTGQFKTLVYARVPRLHCPTHGIKHLRVPWAEPDSRFTALGGNQYLNSSAIGNYADYLTREIIPFVDREFRTLATGRAERALGDLKLL